MKTNKERECWNCGEIRRTTNTEQPYICEPKCLRIEGRALILGKGEYQKRLREDYDQRLLKVEALAERKGFGRGMRATNYKEYASGLILGAIVGFGITILAVSIGAGLLG